MARIKTFGPVDERSLKQLERCMEAGEAELGVLCADHERLALLAVLQRLEKKSFERYLSIMSTPARSITLTDPRALRALAHPLRPRLLGLLRRDGPLTATQAGELVGESPASCSFHFRQLARFGLVEEAGGGRGRERPWQATAQFTSWPAGTDDPELAEAGQQFERVVAQRYLEHILGWIERRRDELPEWQEAVVFGDASLYLTVEELADLQRELEAIVDRFQPRTTNPELRPDGARRVVLIKLAFPADGG